MTMLSATQYEALIVKALAVQTGEPFETIREARMRRILEDRPAYEPIVQDHTNGSGA